MPPQIADHIHQMAQRSPEAIKAPHHQGVAGLRSTQRVVKSRPVESRAGNAAVRQNRVTSRCLERQQLQVQILFLR
ncbi:hypothetical protein WK94_19170 [Burkholderia ubonensis]|nr:hypothetical protein WK94_19170 [Burkholderia ubonensis]